MAYIREKFDGAYGRPFNPNEQLPYSVKLTDCTNIGEIESAIYRDSIIAAKYHVTHFLDKFEDLPYPYKEPNYSTRYWEIRFLNYQDAVRIKLMMRF